MAFGICTRTRCFRPRRPNVRQIRRLRDFSTEVIKKTHTKHNYFIAITLPRDNKSKKYYQLPKFFPMSQLTAIFFPSTHGPSFLYSVIELLMTSPILIHLISSPADSKMNCEINVPNLRAFLQTTLNFCPSSSRMRTIQ